MIKLFILLFLWALPLQAEPWPLARDGYLDLRNVDFPRVQGPLRGEWLFYPGVFLKAKDLEAPDFALRRAYKVPTDASWTEIPELRDVQWGTYYLRVSLPPIGNQLLGIQENVGINSAFELELAPEGKVIARAGQIGTSVAEEVAWWLQKDFPLPEAGRDKLELLLRVSSFSYFRKGILLPPRIGEWMQLSRETHLQQLGVVAALATLMSLAIYHFILFLVRRDDKTNAVFALSSLLMVVRMITADRVIEPLFPEGWAFYAAINYRLLYCLMIVIAVVLHYYFCCLIEGFMHRLQFLVKPALAVSAALAVLPFLLPDYPAVHSVVFLYEMQVCGAAALGLGLLIRHAIHHPIHKVEARVCMALGSCFLVSVVNDIGYMHYWWNTMNVSPYALIGLYIGQSVLVARKYRKDYALRKKLQESRAVQEAFLPAEQQYPGMRTSCHYQVAEEQAGGDLYDLHYDAARERFYAFIGDVTGHGIASALVAGAASGAIHSTLAVCQNQDLGLEETLRELSHALNLSVLSAGRRADRLMTFTILGIDMKSGAGMYVNAGHNATFLIHAGKTHTLIHSSSPLGLHDQVPFAPVPFQIESGTRIFLYTDGLIENVGLEQKTVKIKKVTDIIAKAPALTAARDGILRYGAGVWEQNPPEDDVTFVILEWDPGVAA